MRKKLLLLFMIIGINPFLYGQSQEIAQLLLNVEKLAQLKQILSDMEKGYEIVSKGYNAVKDLSQGNFSLHKTFLDGLMEVSPAVKKYKKVADIINYQLLLVREYKNAWSRFKQSGYFSDDEIAYLGRVYDNLFRRSLRNLDELTMVVTAGQLRMSDDERLSAIDRIHLDMRDKLDFLRSFNNNTSLLGLQRAKELNDVKTMRGIYGIKD